MESTTGRTAAVIEALQVPEEIGEVKVSSLYEALQQVTDRRGKRGRRYAAALVLTLMVLAKLAHEESVSGIAEWVRLRLDWLQTVLPLKRAQLPCANTYVYVCERVEVTELNQVLAAFFADLQARQLAAEEATTEPDHLLLDGKALRGSGRDTDEAQEATFVLSAYSAQQQAVVQQVAIEGKGHEREAALALLPTLDLQGRLVSADALHTQPAWCKQVLAQGGDYLLKVKRNQRTLYADIALLFSETPAPWLPEQATRSVESGHGRLTVRTLRVSSQLNDYLAQRWPGVAQVFQIERWTTRAGQTTYEVVYGLTSLSAQEAPPSRLLHLVRQYWHIENRLHWRRDVTLGEDHCTVSRGQVPQVLALLNSTVLALMDWLGVTNVPAQMRQFAARPADALNLLLLPL